MFKLLIFIIFISPSFHYLNLGIGSIYLYFIMGSIATFVYFFKGIFYNLKKNITNNKINKGLRDLNYTDILFYSESRNSKSGTTDQILEIIKK